ncbi:hypothetical protein DIC82_15220 [Clostridium beijerinckii]|nr:hypothetical protein DIC82_15220 [Clostridium beijerinckii]
MKKYLNKGLLYTWFNSAKVPIIIGIFVWGIIANRIIENNLSNLKSNMAYNFSNGFYTTNLDSYFMLGVIFIAISFIAQGINKRNTIMFLSSGPYTKKQIKYNELISILITLVFFVITYAYIAFMAYVRNMEFLNIVEGYQIITFIEIIRIILIGIIGIVFMLIVDLLFSNSVIGFISMIFVIPISVYFIFVKLYSISEYFGVGNNYSLADKINGSNSNGEFEKYTVRVLLERASIKDVTARELSIEIIIALCIITIMIIIFNIAQKRYKLECCNKIFSSRINEDIIVILISLALGSFASLFFASDFINNMQRKNDQYLPLVGLDLVKGLSTDLLCVGIVGFISYKIMKRILKNIV